MDDKEPSPKWIHGRFILMCSKKCHKPHMTGNILYTPPIKILMSGWIPPIFTSIYHLYTIYRLYTIYTTHHTYIYIYICTHTYIYTYYIYIYIYPAHSPNILLSQGNPSKLHRTGRQPRGSSQRSAEREQRERGAEFGGGGGGGAAWRGVGDSRSFP